MVHDNKTSINEKLKEFKYERPGSPRNPSLGKWLRHALCRHKWLFSPLPLSAASQALEKEWGVSQTPDRKARRVTPPWRGTQLHLCGTCLPPHPFLLPSLPAWPAQFRLFTNTVCCSGICWGSGEPCMWDLVPASRIFCLRAQRNPTQFPSHSSEWHSLTPGSSFCRSHHLDGVFSS